MSAAESTASFNSETKLSRDMIVFPNPASNNLNVSFSLNTGQSATLRLRNIFGQIVLQESMIGSGLRQEQKIDLSQTPVGVYVLQLSVAKEIGSKVIVVVK
ncbi:T9SS type A sorting domain-containing protein [Dyadobacter subterraneus]